MWKILILSVSLQRRIKCTGTTIIDVKSCEDFGRGKIFNARMSECKRWIKGTIFEKQITKVAKEEEHTI